MGILNGNCWLSLFIRNNICHLSTGPSGKNEATGRKEGRGRGRGEREREREFVTTLSSLNWALREK